jgi:hypothetical protein
VSNTITATANRRKFAPTLTDGSPEQQRQSGARAPSTGYSEPMSVPILFALLSLPPGWSTIAHSPAVQAIAHADAVVMLSGDLLHVSAVEMSGAPRWRREYQKTAAGVQALQVWRDALFLVAGPQVARLRMKTGRTTPWQTAPAIGTSAQPGCWLNETAGALAYGCPCSFQFARANATPVGKRHDYFRQCRTPYGGGQSKCGCWGSSGRLIGRAQGLQIASVPTPQPAGHRGKRRVWSQTLVAVSAKRGREVWRHPSPNTGPATDVNGAGILPDAQGFWTADARGRLAMFEVKSGRTRWQMPPSKTSEGPSKNVWIAALGAGAIFVATHETAMALDTKTGKPRWSVAKSGDAVLPLGALDHPGGVGLREAPMLRLLDDRTGAVVTTMPLGEAAHIERAADGEIWMVSGTRLFRFTAAGRLLSQATVAAHSTLTRGETVVLASTAETLQAFDAKTLAPLGTLAGRYEVVQLEGPAGAGRVWIHTRGEAPSLRLIRIDAPAR